MILDDNHETQNKSGTVPLEKQMPRVYDPHQ